MNLNDVKIVGNAVRDPEIRYTPKGTPVANISLGINEIYTNDDEKRKVTTFVDIQAWGPSAENLAKLVHKGQEIFVEGALRQDQWEDKKTKQKRSRLFVKVDRWQLTQYKSGDQAKQQAEVVKAKGKER